MPTPQLKQLRNNLLRMRENYTALHNHSKELANLLKKHPRIKGATCLAAYHAFRGEISCQCFIEDAWQHQKIYLPVCKDKPRKHMVFRQYTKQGPLDTNQYGILEPDCSSSEIDELQLDCVITPMLGFNNNNYRLGYGCGYYDHSFAFKRNNPASKPFLLGVAYDFQLTSWNTHQYDVPLDDILIIPTEHA